MQLEEKIEYKRLWLSAFIPLLFTFIIWIIHFIQVAFCIDFTHLGVYPLKLKGLLGIILSPLIHGSWEHLFSNTIPLVVLGTMLFYFYPKSAFKVFILLYFVTSIWVWFGARQAYHIGSSGIIYGLASYIFTCGILLQSTSLLSISLLVVFLYGSLIWGLFPLNWEISWESHISGFVLGIILAFYYKSENRYLEQLPEWMKEENDDNENNEYNFHDENNKNETTKPF